MEIHAFIVREPPGRLISDACTKADACSGCASVKYPAPIGPDLGFRAGFEVAFTCRAVSVTPVSIQRVGDLCHWEDDGPCAWTGLEPA